MTAISLKAVLAVCLLGGGLAAEPLPRPCEISGRVRLLDADGKARDAKGSAVVYVAQLDPSLWHIHFPDPGQIDQVSKQFSPQLKAIGLGNEVRFFNRDLSTNHNVFLRENGKVRDLGESREGMTGRYTFDWRGKVHVQCNIHPRMTADVLVLQNPYFDVVGDHDGFHIPPLPAGSYELIAEASTGRARSAFISGCIGARTQVFQLEETKPPVARRKDGTIYPEISYGP